MSNSDLERKVEKTLQSLINLAKKNSFDILEVYKKFLTLNMSRVWYRTVKDQSCIKKRS